MPEFYYPTSQEILDLIKTVPQGFQFEFYEDQTATLFIKFDMAVLMAIIKGSNLRIIIQDPFIENIPYLVEILDNPNNPLVIETSIEMQENTIHEHVHKLVELKQLKISLLNELTTPVYSFSVDLNINTELWSSWIKNIAKQEPDVKSKEFIIDIKNRDHSNEPKFISITNMVDPLNQQIISANNLDVDNFLQDGRHGYSQEDSIGNILQLFFKINENLFISPKYENGNEFCDFVILLEQTCLLFESKFVISSKPTKVAGQLKKGVEQLFRAKSDIFEKTLSLHDKVLQKKILTRKYPLNILLYNGAVNLTQKRCHSWFPNPIKMEVPMFMSVNSLNQLINAFYIKSPINFHSNLDLNFFRIFDNYYFSRDSPDFLIFDNFNFKWLDVK